MHTTAIIAVIIAPTGILFLVIIIWQIEQREVCICNFSHSFSKRDNITVRSENMTLLLWCCLFLLILHWYIDSKMICEIVNVPWIICRFLLMLISMRNEGLIHNMTYLNIWGKKLCSLWGDRNNFLSNNVMHKCICLGSVWILLIILFSKDAFKWSSVTVRIFIMVKIIWFQINAFLLNFLFIKGFWNFFFTARLFSTLIIRNQQLGILEWFLKIMLNWRLE